MTAHNTNILSVLELFKNNGLRNTISYQKVFFEGLES